MNFKTPAQQAADRLHKRLSLPTNRAKPRNTQQLVITPRSTEPYPGWNKHNER